MRITDLQSGDVFRLKSSTSDRLFAQVGEGGDIGIFDVASADAVKQSLPLFRVGVNEPDFRRRWQKVGNLPFSAPLRKLAWFGDSDIGSDRRYKVQLDNVERRCEIAEAEFDGLESLAVWETSCILERLRTA